ncbi:MAG: pseudouridine-5'-phosphate glycosidase [Kiloniellales bacterium]
MTLAFVLSDEVAEALAAGQAVVALESTVIAQGLPSPHNLDAARRMDAAVRAAGAVPAMIAVIEGRPTAGLDSAQIERLAAGGFVKASRRDLAGLVAGGVNGATTVAATMALAHQAGIEVFATGGIGGVHRGADTSFDISADLTELARTPVAVVAAGAKAVLDLPRTLEVLETLGVPVIGYRIDELPAFYTAESGLAIEGRVESAQEAARLTRAHWELGLRSGLLIANPPPADLALPAGLLEGWIAAALAEAAAAGVTGKVVTPFLLARLAALSEGRTLALNVALLESNARLAGAIAAALTAETSSDL